MSRRSGQLKSPQEIELLTRGGALLRRVLEEVAALAQPGTTGAQLDREAERRLRAAGAEPSFKGYAGEYGKPFPAALCVSVNNAIVHGVPTEEPLHEGDVVGLDLGCIYKGLYTDTAMTVIVGRGLPVAVRLITVTRQALAAGIAAVRPGSTTGDIGAAIQRVIESAGFSVVRDLTGHGVGYAVHEDPRVPNYGHPGEGTTLAEDLVIAIEPMVIAGKDDSVRIAEDGWTVLAADAALTAHEEHTIAVTKDGARILTQAQ